MCGIAAVLGRGATAERVRRMSDALHHRGPDDSGVWTAPSVALAQRRLSIIDLSASGHQPMTSHDGRYQIVFNGEIYNYVSIATEIGAAWRGKSDTEVLLEAFAKWGPACLERLSGMFAFVVWDTLERRAFCARDRVGIKPLYMARFEGGWAIASEIGALLAGGIPARANETIIYDFLARDFYEHSDETFFRGIVKLPPGHWTWLTEATEPRPQRYWDLAAEASRADIPRDRAERGAELIARMERSVALALRSDVPVGITLSGGLDSAVLLALVDRAQPHEKVATFSFDFDDPAYSERPWVEAMAAQTGHQARFRRVTANDFESHADKLMGQQQEPHAGAPIAAYTLCFEMLRHAGVIVAMDGSGIDEALGGYDRFRPARWADLKAYGEVEALSKELLAAGVTTSEDRARAAEQMRAAAAVVGDVGKAQDLSSSVRPECIASALRAEAADMPAFERPFPDALRNLLFRELRYTKLPRALRFRDRLSMAHGTELRPPFLDHELLAWMFALPPEDRILLGTTKSLLREAAARLLPDAVRLASKRSVQTPQREWFRGPLRAWARQIIDQPSFWGRGWVEREPAMAALDRFQSGEGSNSFFVWQWIALETWARRYLDGAK